MANLDVNVNVAWDGGVKGNGTLKSEYLNTKVAIPTSLGGSGEGANPKELLVASATTCYLATLRYVLASNKLPVATLAMDTETTTVDGSMQMNHFPHIELSTDATELQVQSAERAIQAADKGCEVGNLLKHAGVKIEVQGKVSIQ